MRLWEVRTTEYLCLTLGAYIHRELQKNVMSGLFFFFRVSKNLWFPLTERIRYFFTNAFGVRSCVPI